MEFIMHMRLQLKHCILTRKMFTQAPVWLRDEHTQPISVGTLHDFSSNPFLWGHNTTVVLTRFCGDTT